MRKLVLAAVLVLMASGAQSATLNVIGGQLHGASGVLVDGSLYNVQFLGGTCIDLFNGCNEVSDFTFHTEASATLASQALLDQVLIDDPVLGSFDSNPIFTNGCTDNTSCGVWTPYDLIGGGAGLGWPYRIEAHNAGPAGSTDSLIRNYYHSPQYDTALYGWKTFAIWTPIPEPSTALLLSLGLVGMAARRRV